jgi:hypothetical protein
MQTKHQLIHTNKWNQIEDKWNQIEAQGNSHNFSRSYKKKKDETESFQETTIPFIISLARITSQVHSRE